MRSNPVDTRRRTILTWRRVSTEKITEDDDFART